MTAVPDDVSRLQTFARSVIQTYRDLYDACPDDAGQFSNERVTLNRLGSAIAALTVEAAAQEKAS